MCFCVLVVPVEGYCLGGVFGFRGLFGELVVLLDDASIGVFLGVVGFQHAFGQVVQRVDAPQGIAYRDLQTVTHAVETYVVGLELVETDLPLVLFLL